MGLRQQNTLFSKVAIFPFGFVVRSTKHIKYIITKVCDN